MRCPCDPSAPETQSVHQLGCALESGHLCPEGHRTQIMATFRLAMRINFYILCSAASDAVTHFLGVSSLNSGRSQGRPFFHNSAPGLRVFWLAVSCHPAAADREAHSVRLFRYVTFLG